VSFSLTIITENPSWKNRGTGARTQRIWF